MSNRRSKIHGGKTRAAIALIYRLAALMRASFLYPVNNQRVIEARQEFLNHSKTWVGASTSLSIESRDGAVILNGVPVNTPTQLAGWIEDCFEQAFLTGMEISPDIDADSIGEIAATLRRCEEEQITDCQSLWRGEYFGLIPILERDADAESEPSTAPTTPMPAALAGLNWTGAEQPADVNEITPQGPAHQDTQLDELTEDIKKLPFSAMLGLAADDARQETELFGIYLHRYQKELNDQTAERLGKRFIAMLEAPSPGMLKILESYLDSTTTILTEAAGSKRNLVEFLQRNGHANLLRKNESLRPDVVAFSFPENFTLFLDSLSADRPRDMKSLRDACFAVDKERMEKATETLIGEGGILTLERVNLITAVGTYEALPLVSIIAAHGPNWTRSPVAQFLRKQEFPEAETAALRAINPPSLLPAGYLHDLCELHSVFDGSAKLREFSGFLVRRFIEDSASHPEQAERRIYAIRSLRNLPSLESIKLLKKLSAPTRLLSLNRTARTERQAALETLHEMVGD